MAVHVDDVLMIGNKVEITKLKKTLSDAYKFKDLGPACKYVGLFIKRD